jgi:hypothetical protein
MSTRRPKRAPFVYVAPGAARPRRSFDTPQVFDRPTARSPDGPIVLALSQLARVFLSALGVLRGNPLLLNLKDFHASR